MTKPLSKAIRIRAYVSVIPPMSTSWSTKDMVARLKSILHPRGKGT
jgi:hypothetical protein